MVDYLTPVLLAVGRAASHRMKPDPFAMSAIKIFETVMFVLVRCILSKCNFYYCHPNSVSEEL